MKYRYVEAFLYGFFRLVLLTSYSSWFFHIYFSQFELNFYVLFESSRPLVDWVHLKTFYIGSKPVTPVNYALFKVIFKLAISTYRFRTSYMLSAKCTTNGHAYKIQINGLNWTWPNSISGYCRQICRRDDVASRSLSRLIPDFGSRVFCS